MINTDGKTPEKVLGEIMRALVDKELIPDQSKELNLI
jgi:hypothetical protein